VGIILRANIVTLVRESFEQVKQQLYAAYELMDQLNLEDREQSQRMEEWANHVQATLGSLTSVRAEDVLTHTSIRPIHQWVDPLIDGPLKMVGPAHPSIALMGPAHPSI